MKFFTYKVSAQNGIHARPAGELVNTAKEFSSVITIKKGNREADAKRLFSIMSLEARKGDELSFYINGVDELEAARAIEKKLNEGHFNESAE